MTSSDKSTAIEELFGADLMSRYRRFADTQIDDIAIDADAWNEAAAALGLADGCKPPNTLGAAIGSGYSQEMRITALVLAQYLEHGLGLQPVAWEDAAEVVNGVFHHGDVSAQGDWSYWRFGEPRCCLVTGNLTVTGTISSSAFDGELMVGGDISCGRLITDTELGVGGTVRCRYARLGWYDCTTAATKLITDVYIDHGMMIEGDVEARLHLYCEDHSMDLPESEHAKLRDVLLPELADEILASGSPEDIYAALDSALGERLVRGEPVFK